MTDPHKYNPWLGYPSRQSIEQEEKADAVPTGTVPEILDWVGEDKDRAAKALEAEEANSRPRKTLVEDLKGILDDSVSS